MKIINFILQDGFPFAKLIIAKVKRWFLSQAGKAIDCNSITVGSNPAGTSNFGKNH